MGPDAAIRPRSRLLVAAILPAIAAFLGFAQDAYAGAFTPEHGGSPNADDIALLYEIVLYVAIFVFVVVEGALVYSLIRFRAKKGAVPAQIHGNTRLEVGWTIAAAVIVVVLTVITFAKLADITDPPSGGPGKLPISGATPLYATIDQPNPPGGRTLNIDVIGLQYVWRFVYPNRAYSYEQMVVPADTTVVLRIRSQDVQHSWWIPKLGGKADAVPGYTNETWFKVPSKNLGSKGEVIYRGQCAELCGTGHANMFGQVKVVTPQAYEKWVAAQKLLIDQANKEALKLRPLLERAPGASAPQPTTTPPAGK